MSDHHRVSVVIPVFNGATVIGLQLDALSRQSVDTSDVVIADNGSTDDTGAVVERWRSRIAGIRVVDASARRGPAAARNIGAAEATGDFLAFCDADDVVDPRWLESIASPLDHCDVVGGAVEYETLEHKPSLGPIDPSPSHYEFLPAGLGANLGIRRSSFRAIGGFDERLHAGEDVDLCWRLQLAGCRFQYQPDAVVHKRRRERTIDALRQELAYGRHDAILYRRYRNRGMRRKTGLALKSYAYLLVHLPYAWAPTKRRMWWSAVGKRSGRLIGCVEQRVLYL